MWENEQGADMINEGKIGLLTFFYGPDLRKKIV